ncbi:MAG: signal peptidase II [Gammaproteobacteria bacterium]|nr:signal peptidase II [Gammaproteobacteria bacterium]|tara:strand:+ start:1804 stop:2358 length:555 start_codon:yes stop_codon:yes gene_type:complete
MSELAPDQSTVATARIRGNLLRWIPLAVVVAGLDQATKAWVTSALVHGERIQILPFFAWVRWHNEGAAFSFLASAGGWQRWFFILLALVFSVYVIWELARLSYRERHLGAVYGLILGGAVGNVIDRIVHGHVVDFVLLHYQQHIFPAFNVADSALFCGVVLWGLLLFQQFRQDRADRNDPAARR